MKLFRTLLAGIGAAALTLSAHAAGGAKHAHAPEGGWDFAKIPAGQLDKESVQRGYQVYREVCSSCHGMNLLSYRNLGEKGAPFYDSEYPNANDNPLVKQFASEYEIIDATPDENGDPVFRPARPSDRFRSPYPNKQAGAAANNGAFPPDLSVITKARGHGHEGDGASYVYSLMSGYPSEEAIEVVEIQPAQIITPASDNGTPEDLTDDIAEVVEPAVFETRIFPARMKAFKDDGHYHFEAEDYIVQPLGLYYNPYMAGDVTPQWSGDPRHVPPGGFLAMPSQLAEGRVEYIDGTEATQSQMAKDVAQFLHWAGDPKQAQRKSLALPTMLYLVLLAILLWFSYKRIWRNVEH